VETIISVAKLPERQQDALIVATSVASGALLYIVHLYPLYQSGRSDPAPSWLRLALFASICAVELFRRRAPAAALAAGAVLVVMDCFFGPSMAMLMVFADLLYAAALYGGSRLRQRLVPMVAVATLFALGVALIVEPDRRVAFFACMAALPFVVVPIWWGTNVRQHRDIAAAERTNAAQLAKISELDRSAAIAAERARMARDLHDVIAGRVSAIAIQSEAVLSVSFDDEKTVHRVMTAVRENSVRALEEMRAMIELLRADGTAATEVKAPARLADLASLIESARASGMQVELRSEIDTSFSLPAAVDLTAYRIAQEALTNVVKHAPRTSACVGIRYVEGSLVVEVSNEFSGMEAEITQAGSSRTGLLNMRERAAVVGGSLIAGPYGSGWLVRAVLPVGGAES
jgi:signal transduction histidine kinase